MVVQKIESRGKSARQELTVSRGDLDWAAGEGGIISHDQAARLWDALQTRKGSDSRLDLAHVLWYGGAVLVLLAMAWFMFDAWDKLGAAGMVGISAVYTLGFIGCGWKLWFKDDLQIPGGLLFTLAVSMTPLTVWGVGTLVGQNMESTGGAMAVEIATLLASLSALRFIRFPFLTFPLSVSAWALALTVAESATRGMEWTAYLHVTMGFGLVMLIVSFLVDRRTREDFAFWGYLFGLVAFWGSLSLLDANTELGKFAYLLVNLALMLASVLLNRRVFLVAGSAGTLYYVGHVLSNMFDNVLAFVCALAFLGMLTIWLGTKYHKNRASIESFVLGLVPASLKKHLPEWRQ